ncbi:hypothetical protein ACQ4M4_19620 [Leptolyngbya sp. AN02str]|uniref:hypothetical protein n=1 Tax=Leptolyngbya sp. AN02str TaxID=3423363 RepID=UPI003D321E90
MGIDVGVEVMQLSDWITPTTPAGTALFLRWNGYHVFSIPKRELARSPHSLRFFGVGGKRTDPQESFVDCALRESVEEIGDVVSSINPASQTHLLQADGTIRAIELVGEAICPRLILEKRKHTGYGSLAGSDRAYYLVAYNASLSQQPHPYNEIAALLYLQDQHLQAMHKGQSWALADALDQGAIMQLQAGVVLEPTATLVPHGTAQFLVKAYPDSL